MEGEMESKEKARMDDGSPSDKLESFVSSQLKPERQTSKTRKLTQKTVVKVKVGETVGKLIKNEGPPSDRWSWRKYGQKPIKGSPFPRAYYRCSSSKGCSAKKQVERCRTDASLLIITYTSSHNHLDPDVCSTTNLNKELKDPLTQTTERLPAYIQTDDQRGEDGQKCRQQNGGDPTQDRLHFLPSPMRNSQSSVMADQVEEPSKLKNPDTSQETVSLILQKEDSFSYSLHTRFSTTKSEEDDFFDELGELPTSLSFSNFMNSYLPHDRIQVIPS